MSESENDGQPPVVEAEDWIDQALKAGMGFKSDKEKKDYVDGLGDPLMHPMFATSAEDLAGNPLADAFRQLNEEDKTNYELAIMYKDEANTHMKHKETKFYHLAEDRYKYAMTFIDTEMKARQTSSSGNDAVGDLGTDDQLIALKSQLFSNLALAALSMGNHAQCITHCDVAVQLLPSNIKAHFRKCTALAKLKKYELALAACAVGVAQEGAQSTTFASIQRTCEAELKKADAIFQKKKLLLEQKHAEWSSAWDIKVSFGAQFGIFRPRPGSTSRNKGKINSPAWLIDVEDEELWENSGSSPAQLQHTIPFYDTDAPSNVQGEALWPVLFLYPQYHQIDIIQGWQPEVSVRLHLENMFPVKGSGEEMSYPPWDLHREYHVDNLVVYFSLQLPASTTTDPSSKIDESSIIKSKEEWIQMCYDEFTFKGDTHLLPLSTICPATSLPTPPITTALHSKGPTVMGWGEVSHQCPLAMLLSLNEVVVPGGLVTFYILPKFTSLKSGKLSKTFSSSHQLFLDKLKKHSQPIVSLQVQ